MFKKNSFTLAVIIPSILFVLLLTVVRYVWNTSVLSQTAESLCRTNDSGSSYCRYKGAIGKYYINSDGLALFYIGDDFDKKEALDKGYDITSVDVVAVQLGAGKFEDEKYTALVNAFDKADHVEIHMRRVEKGFLIVDRVWVAK
jgi:hypothetical protein